MEPGDPVDSNTEPGLDPDVPGDRAQLVSALDAERFEDRRSAVVALAGSTDGAVRSAALVTGFHDPAPPVRRSAIRAAADLEDPEYRPLFEEATHDPDPWIRWRSIRALRDLGPEPSLDEIIVAAVDDDERVRLEAEAALRDAGT